MFKPLADRKITSADRQNPMDFVDKFYPQNSSGNRKNLLTSL